MNNSPFGNAPDFCASEWCYIDINNCNLPVTGESSYFPDADIIYSYQTCGHVNTW